MCTVLPFHLIVFSLFFLFLLFISLFSFFAPSSLVYFLYFSLFSLIPQQFERPFNGEPWSSTRFFSLSSLKLLSLSLSIIKLGLSLSFSHNFKSHFLFLLLLNPWSPSNQNLPLLLIDHTAKAGVLDLNFVFLRTIHYAIF